MPWLVLFCSSLLEAVWATALGASDGFTEAVPTLVFFATLAISLTALSYVVKRIPISVTYAVWSGSGAACTVLWSMATGHETVSGLKLLFLTGIIGCIVGLKLAKPHSGDAGSA
ncbi:DMT family transporter [Streptomyces sp. NBC_00448]|uniref:DMT family transporter n=1 Tax=Streptomyces sp. NBC_00448 TaxID=2903652 RepID=UPI002E20856A